MRINMERQKRHIAVSRAERDVFQSLVDTSEKHELTEAEEHLVLINILNRTINDRARSEWAARFPDTEGS